MWCRPAAGLLEVQGATQVAVQVRLFESAVPGAKPALPAVPLELVRGPEQAVVRQPVAPQALASVRQEPRRKRVGQQERCSMRASWLGVLPELGFVFVRQTSRRGRRC